GVVHAGWLAASRPSGHHLVPVSAHPHSAAGALRNARGPAHRLHQVCAGTGPAAKHHPFRPCPEEHPGARHYHYRPAAGRHHRLCHCDRNRIPVAWHGAVVHTGCAVCRCPRDGRLPVSDRPGLRVHQPDCGPAVFCGGSAPAHRAWRQGRHMTRLERFWDHDITWSWRQSPVAMVATVLTVLLFVGAFGAPWVSPYNPFDLATVDLFDALLPPAWNPEGDA